MIERTYPMTKSIYACDKCSKTFSTQISLSRHNWWHDDLYRKNAEEIKENSKMKRINEYNINPNHCLRCNSIIPYDKRKNNYCSKTCSAIVNNTISPRRIKVDYPKSKVTPVICNITGKIWFRSKHRKSSPYYDADKLSKKEYYRLCNFSFSIENEPIKGKDLISLYKMWDKSDPTSKIKILQRDHMYSKSDGWKNQIDPSIISHPANCELMKRITNIKKGKSSSITLEELMKRISDWGK